MGLASPVALMGLVVPLPVAALSAPSALVDGAPAAPMAAVTQRPQKTHGIFSLTRLHSCGYCCRRWSLPGW